MLEHRPKHLILSMFRKCLDVCRGREWEATGEGAGANARLIWPSPSQPEYKPIVVTSILKSEAMARATNMRT